MKTNHPKYQCTICGEKNNLHVHLDPETQKIIFSFKELKDEPEDTESIDHRLMYGGC